MSRIAHLCDIEITSLSNPHADLPTGMQMLAQLITFMVAIMRKTQQGNRLLGSIEIAKDEALTAGEQQKPFHGGLARVNPDGPTLHLTMTFSISESIPEALGHDRNDIQGIQKWNTPANPGALGDS
ncbi:hypothetical protein K438DRAFT_1786401 [Mycena galopus ATCC 62051]|nr:hypothetical protein K438DRAFT_1786401 [Mycena galopus ATCC 62051]